MLVVSELDDVEASADEGGYGQGPGITVISLFEQLLFTGVVFSTIFFVFSVFELEVLLSDFEFHPGSVCLLLDVELQVTLTGMTPTRLYDTLPPVPVVVGLPVPVPVSVPVPIVVVSVPVVVLLLSVPIIISVLFLVKLNSMKISMSRSICSAISL